MAHHYSLFLLLLFFSLILKSAFSTITIISPVELVKELNYSIPAKYSNYGKMNYGISNVLFFFEIYSMEEFTMIRITD